jgi:hypothetical protein
MRPLLIIAFLLLLCSCNSLMHRRYMKGFYLAKTGARTDKALPEASPVAAPRGQQYICSAINEQVPQSPTTVCAEKNTMVCEKFPADSKRAMARSQNLAFQKQPALQSEFQPPKKELGHRMFLAKPLSLFWIVILAVLILYLAVILFAAETLMPLGHVVGIVFAALLLLWLLMVL